MNGDVKEAWVAALRSDEYPQSRGELRARDGYCCLGVLTDLAVKAGVGVRWWQDGDGFYGVERLEGGLCYPEDGLVLAPVVRDWAGLDANDPSIGGKSLSDLNDGECLSFDEIADLVEENL